MASASTASRVGGLVNNRPVFRQLPTDHMRHKGALVICGGSGLDAAAARRLAADAFTSASGKRCPAVQHIVEGLGHD